MALKKTIRNEKGIDVTYHKISRFMVDSDNEIVQVFIRHYTLAKFRDLDRKKKSSDNELKDKYSRLGELIANPSDANLEERIELTQYVNGIQEVQNGKISYYVDESQELIPFDPEGDYSITGMYNELLKLEKYKDAKNS